jgi:hypothetical protein
MHRRRLTRSSAGTFSIGALIFVAASTIPYLGIRPQEKSTRAYAFFHVAAM